MSASEPHTILLAGGGTGGHIFPLLAVAESIRSLQPSSTCRFVCSTRPLDATILTREGAPFDAIAARPFGTHPKTLAKFMLGWPGSVQQARAVIAAHAPRVVITSGGFVSAPVVQAARRARIPVVAVNLDAVAGKANRWIARHAAVCVSTTEAETDAVPAAWLRIAPIVRRSMRMPRDVVDSRRALGLDPDLNTLLVTGGSQGAQTMNSSIAWMVRHRTDVFAGWQVLHQCGGQASQAEMLRDVYVKAGVPALVLPFIEDMATAWWASDLAVSRAGAGAVAEVRATCVPTIFVPYPFHKDNHQARNCAFLCERAEGALEAADDGDLGWTIDAIDADPGPWDIEQPLTMGLTDGPWRAQASDNLRRLGEADGADTVAKIVRETSIKPRPG